MNTPLCPVVVRVRCGIAKVRYQKAHSSGQSMLAAIAQFFVSSPSATKREYDPDRTNGRQDNRADNRPRGCECPLAHVGSPKELAGVTRMLGRNHIGPIDKGEEAVG